MIITAAGAIVPAADKAVQGRRLDGLDSGFAVPAAAVASVPGASSLPSGTSAVCAAAAMLALQEEVELNGDTGANLADREARKHAHDLLEALATLQRELLAGGSPTSSLSRLSALAQMTSSLHDPTLARIVASIRLRAQLEIIRLTPPSVEQPASASGCCNGQPSEPDREVPL